MESLLEVDEDASQGSDRPISVIEITTGKRLSGDEAPMLSQLQDFLVQNPGWEIAETDDDDSDEEGYDDEDGNDKRYQNNFCEIHTEQSSHL